MKFKLINSRNNIGELEIGGPQVSLGYINAQNKHNFLKKKIFWYKTGDICKKLIKTFTLLIEKIDK